MKQMYYQSDSGVWMENGNDSGHQKDDKTVCQSQQNRAQQPVITDVGVNVLKAPLLKGHETCVTHHLDQYFAFHNKYLLHHTSDDKKYLLFNN